MAAAARTLDLVDAAAAAVRAAWAAWDTPPGATDAVERAYAPTVGLDPDQPDTLLAGRRVYLFPAAYADRQVDRATYSRTHTVGCLVVERYGGAAPVPAAWLDERVRFVERVVFATLRHPALVLAGDVVTGARPDPDTPAAVESVYDLDRLLEHGAFWSTAAFTFFDLTDLEGE